MTAMSQKPQSDDTSGGVCRAVTDEELDALVKPLEWTEESPGFWIGRGSFGFQRDYRVSDGVAKIYSGPIGMRVTPDRARGFYDREYVEFVLGAIDTSAITTLRAQLAEAEARGYELAKTEALQCGWHLRRYELAKRDAEIASAIRAQPHSRTALDRYREKVLREAEVAYQLAILHGCNPSAAILALIEREGM